MRTDQLIDFLAAELKPVDRRRSSRALIVALAVGSAAALGAMLIFFCTRYEPLDAENLVSLSIQLLCTLAIVAIAAAYLPQFACPNAKGRSFVALISIPFGAIVAFAAVVFAFSHRVLLDDMIFDKEGLACLFYIPFSAIVPFAAVVWALRTGAPTDLTRAGAAAGLVAGALSAAACSFPCAIEPYLSIALWHGLAIEICPKVGVKLGPRLLRW